MNIVNIKPKSDCAEVISYIGRDGTMVNFPLPKGQGAKFIKQSKDVTKIGLWRLKTTKNGKEKKKVQKTVSK